VNLPSVAVVAEFGANKRFVGHIAVDCIAVDIVDIVDNMADKNFEKCCMAYATS